MACPFGQSPGVSPEVKPTATGWQARKQHVIYLYAEYVHLNWLQEVWTSPLTEKPLLEPCFAAAFHGIELCFLLLAEFVADKRKLLGLSHPIPAVQYVAKRPRIDMVATDIQEQCMLLTEIIDGELEGSPLSTSILALYAQIIDEGLEDKTERQLLATCTADSVHVLKAGCPVDVVTRVQIIDGELEDETERQSRATLTQAFPFEACPPTTRQTSHSPGLQRLADAVEHGRGGMTVAERNSLIKVVLNITNTFDSSFGRWTVGLGIEHQLNELRVAAGLPEEPRFRSRAQNLDYSQLVRPEIVESTLTAEEYVHSEDFFFRTVHLGVECWAFIAHNRVEAALDLAAAGHWHVAAARIMQTSRLLHYLGDHILLLTRDKIRGLFGPFLSAAPEAAASPCPAGVTVSISVQPAGPGSGCAAACQGTATSDAAAAQQSAILAVYQQPDRHAGLYNYAKALESVESALLGGFYYKHFLLAKNVIGTSAKDRKGRIMKIIEERGRNGSPASARGRNNPGG
eukprot:jgi/Astpho2/1752/Aster-04173